MNPLSAIPTRLSNLPTDERPGSTSHGSIASPSFEDTLKGFLTEANQMQENAQNAAKRLLSGQTNDIHQVMILTEKAGIAFDLVMEVRNKLMEGYQETMRMQV